MKLGVIMPHRGDRSLFLDQFHRILARQTLVPDVVEVVDYVPLDDSCDITPRYRYGYDKLREMVNGVQLDVIAFMEVDDWYRDDYLETMVNGWKDNGCPDLFGSCYTVYYNLRLGKSFTFEHAQRSSMMSTLIKPDLDLDWPGDDYPYTDAHLWFKIKNKKTFRPPLICLGLKHGVGKSGGRFHTEGLERYREGIDLKKIVGDDYEFYKGMFPNVSPTVRIGRSLMFKDEVKGRY